MTMRKNKRKKRQQAKSEQLAEHDVDMLLNMMTRKFGEDNILKAFEQMQEAGFADDDPDEAADELMFKAAESVDPEERLELARDALGISHRCTDALLLIAGEPSVPPSARFALAICAERSAAEKLGENYFEENAGHFWGLIETRPYMRALVALSDAEWRMGEREMAIYNLDKLLMLNPNDNQGNRYRYLHCLAVMNMREEADALLKTFKEEESSWWLFGQSLLRFATGKKQQADKLLPQAMASNPHVAAYLTGLKPLPKNLPPYYAMGSLEEAQLYVDQMQDCWQAIPDAVKWVQGVVEGG